MIDIDASTPYTDSVRQNRGGSIHYLEPHTRHSFGPNDAYAHLESKLQGTRTIETRESQLCADQKGYHQRHRGLRYENTRELCRLGKAAICAVAESDVKDPQLFFFGPGAGKEMSQAQALLANATISSNSLTPTSPTLTLQENFNSLRTLLWNAMKQQGNPREQIQFSWMKNATSMNPDFAVKMDRALQTKSFMETLEGTNLPHRQYIGYCQHLPPALSDVTPQNLVYEMHGPLSKIFSERKSRDSVCIMRSVLDRLMSTDTVLVVGYATASIRQALQQILPKFSVIQQDMGVIAFHRQGPHADVLIKSLESFSGTV
jgi:hypothetical protein